ncbi:MAG: hypothetical protein AB8B66_04600 [Rickettsiaceae bacterium]
MLWKEFLQGNIKCNTLQIFLSPAKITGYVMAQETLINEELVAGGLSMITSSNGVLYWLMMCQLA